jgi:hypothetical protein
LQRLDGTAERREITFNSSPKDREINFHSSPKDREINLDIARNLGDLEQLVFGGGELSYSSSDVSSSENSDDCYRDSTSGQEAQSTTLAKKTSLFTPSKRLLFSSSDISSSNGGSDDIYRDSERTAVLTPPRPSPDLTTLAEMLGEIFQLQKDNQQALASLQKDLNTLLAINLHTSSTTRTS